MNWFKKSKPDIKSYYTAVDPELFYEWEFSGFVPQQTPVHYGSTNEVKSLNKTIIGIDCGSSMIESQDGNSRLICDVPVNRTRFIGGIAKSKEDILESNRNLKNIFNNGLRLFIEAMKSRGYFIHGDEKQQNLFAIANCDDKKIQLNDYGKWEDILKKADAAQQNMELEGKSPIFKARDLSDLHRLTHALTQVNYNVPFDKEQIKILVLSHGGEPIRQQEKDWVDIYKQLDKRADILSNKLSQLEQLNWVKHSRQN